MRIHLLSAALSTLTLFFVSACSTPLATSSSAGTGGSGEGGAPTGAGGSGGDGSVGPSPGVDATVAPFDKTHIYFTGDDNKRVVDAQASFPAEGAYSQIMLHL